MLMKVEDMTILPLREMRKKYAKKWFCYVISGDINFENSEANMCYVVFTGDNKQEMYQVPKDGLENLSWGHTFGDEVVHPIEIGGVYWDV